MNEGGLQEGLLDGEKQVGGYAGASGRSLPIATVEAGVSSSGGGSRFSDYGVGGALAFLSPSGEKGGAGRGGGGGSGGGSGQRRGPKRARRLQSLDVARGITIALMIFVDHAGDSWEMIDHTAWNGIRLADFVMPSFDVIVGVAVAFSIQQGRLRRGAGGGAAKWKMARAAVWRAAKLFLLGVWTQSGTGWPTIDLKHVRIMGILQRVSLCYLTASLAEIFLPDVAAADDLHAVRHRPHLRLLLRRAWHWALMAVLVGIWCGIVYGVQVPNDGFFPTDDDDDDDYPCERGSLAPRCNAAAWVDGQVLGKRHMYFPYNGGACEDKEITFQRSPACSSCSPGRCLKEGAPAWCGFDSVCGGAPFDPEGLVSSLTCVVASLVGAHVGSVAFAFPVMASAASAVSASSAGAPPLPPPPPPTPPLSSRPSYAEDGAMSVLHNDRMWHWCCLGVASSLVGLVLHWTRASELNTDLYSPSFLLLTNGASVLGFTLCYRLADVAGGRWNRLLLDPFKWLGMNSIAVYILSCSGISEAILSVVYYGNSDNNLANILWPSGVFWGPEDFGWEPAKNYAQYTHQRKWVMVWVICAYIPFWMAFAYYLHRKKLYFKV